MKMVLTIIILAKLNNIMGGKMKKYNLEPKKVMFVYPKVGKNSNLFLIEGVKNGKSGLKVMPSLIVHNEDGTYTDKVREMFEDSK